ncbi:hypothetical protein F6Y05_36600 [Bacillus megaterium]|nr:hypothetical protein [Priestia megaterium]
MKETEIIENVIGTLVAYHKKQKSFNTIFSNEPVMSKAIEVFDNEILEMVDHIFDSMGIPTDEPKNKYDEKNWTRDVCTALIKIAAKNEKYVAPAVELVSNWKHLSEYTTKVETRTWFNYDQLLDEHLTGYKTWHEKQREKDKENARCKIEAE